MTVRAVLWDFGDTLVDEHWMLAPLEGVEGWPAAYRRIDEKGLATPWNLGQIAVQDVASSLSADLDVPATRVLAHMRTCCQRITFYPRAMELVSNCRLPQAIVTINPDVFTTIVVPHYCLETRFQAIVASWEVGMMSKADLCEVAVKRLGVSLDPAEALLIDNRMENVAEWRARGGAAFHFESERGLVDGFCELLAT